MLLLFAIVDNCAQSAPGSDQWGFRDVWVSEGVQQLYYSINMIILFINRHKYSHKLRLKYFLPVLHFMRLFSTPTHTSITRSSMFEKIFNFSLYFGNIQLWWFEGREQLRSSANCWWSCSNSLWISPRQWGRVNSWSKCQMSLLDPQQLSQLVCL